jgi:hypothetical protein
MYCCFYSSDVEAALRYRETPGRPWQVRRLQPGAGQPADRERARRFSHDGSMSVASTCPAGPTAAASACGIPGPPAPTSQRRQPALTSSRSKCPRVTPSNSSASQANRAPASARALSSRYPRAGAASPPGAVVPPIGSGRPPACGGRGEEVITTWSTSQATSATTTGGGTSHPASEPRTSIIGRCTATPSPLPDRLSLVETGSHTRATGAGDDLGRLLKRLRARESRWCRRERWAGGGGGGGGGPFAFSSSPPPPPRPAAEDRRCRVRGHDRYQAPPNVCAPW